MAVRSPDAHLIYSPRPPVAATEVVAAGGVAAFGAACLLEPAGIEDGPIICPFRLLTGLPCPGCGLTRAWVYLAHGWWGDSFAAHPFGALLVALVLGLAISVVVARLRGRVAPDLNRLVRRPAAVAVLALWLGYAAVRLVLVASGTMSYT